MPDQSRRKWDTCTRISIWLHTARLAFRQGVKLADARVQEANRLALCWIREGMSVREAVRLAGDLAFRRYGERQKRTHRSH